jgi:hypothetical protein
LAKANANASAKATALADGASRAMSVGSIAATVTGHPKLAEGMDKANDRLNDAQNARDVLTGDVEKAVTRFVGSLYDKALGLLARVTFTKLFGAAAGSAAGKVTENLSGSFHAGDKMAEATVHPTFEAAAEQEAYAAAGVANFKQGRIDEALQRSIEESGPIVP